MSCNCTCGTDHKDEKMEKILSKYQKDKSNLIQILNEVQETMDIFLKMLSLLFRNI